MPTEVLTEISIKLYRNINESIRLEIKRGTYQSALPSVPTETEAIRAALIFLLSKLPTKPHATPSPTHPDVV